MDGNRILTHLPGRIFNSPVNDKNKINCYGSFEKELLSNVQFRCIRLEAVKE